MAKLQSIRIHVFFFILVIIGILIILGNEIGQQATENILKIEVYGRDYSSLIMKLRNYEEESILTISHSFSNSNDYIGILNPKLNFNKDNGKYPFLDTQPYNQSMGDYIVYFPIYWSKNSPISIFSERFGITESLFLFPQSEQTQSYEIDFSYLDMDVFNSIQGSKKKFLLSKDDLFDSYFIFGSYLNRCSKDYDDFKVSLLSSEEFIWNDSFCSDIFLIFDFFYNEFGKPINIRSNYIITYSSAKSFNAMGSGIFDNKFNRNFMAHELFHLYIDEANCVDSLLYREGMATYMQYYSQFKSGIKNEKFLEKVFANLFSELSRLKDLNSLYYKDASELLEVRRNNSRTYSLLIYQKGALIWKKIQDSGISVIDLFENTLQQNDCDEINRLFLNFENELYQDLLNKS